MRPFHLYSFLTSGLLNGIVSLCALGLSACGGGSASTATENTTTSRSHSVLASLSSAAMSSLASQNSVSIGSLPTSALPSSVQQSSSSESSSSAIRVTFGGILLAPFDSLADDDSNDLLAPYRDNSTPPQAQPLHHLARVQGYVSATPSGGNSQRERFATQADKDDFFRVSLLAGQRIQLQPFTAGDANNDSDADLYLFNSALDLLAASEGDNLSESIMVTESGDYLINVHAQVGASRYLLHLLPIAPLPDQTTALPNFVPGEMIVKYRRTKTVTAKGTSGTWPVVRERVDVSSTPRDAALAHIQRRNAGAYGRLATLRAVKQVRQQGQVEYAEPNYLRRSLLEPNDAGYLYQWHYRNIQLPAAWDITTGISAEPVVVAVVDTGVLVEHQDLHGVLMDGYDFISNPERARDGDGIDANANDVGDSDIRGTSSWHGTHVAGTIAAATNNREGIAGISWGAKIMPIRALGIDGGTSYDISQGLRYAAGLSNDSNTVPVRRARIINLSLGGPDASLLERDTYAALRAAGVIVVAAAGNAANDAPFYPAAYPGVISVSATDYRHQLAYYSSYGAHVTLAAPGGDLSAEFNPLGARDGIYSTEGDDSRGPIRYIYRLRQGSSMAAPHVSGVIALMLSLYPQLTPAQLDTLIQRGLLSDDLGEPGWDTNFGHGEINALKAVQLARELAEGAHSEEPTLPVNVQLSPRQLSLDFADSGVFSLINQGGGKPQLQSMSADVSWLSASAAQVDEQGLGTYQITVARAGLAPGQHRATLSLHLSEGDAIQLPVTLLVDAATATSATGQVYVSLLNADTGVLHASQAAQTIEKGANFLFSNVVAGRYWLFAGSDMDANGQLCETGESCASYGGVAQPQVLTLGDESLPHESLELPLELLSEPIERGAITY